ncbi:GvpL/GvpF family gas vesicle protein [bacterium]|nr:GvpL/GvpF family gas vesicle protein [bacterium]MCG2677128.1 GvpL/GvpF family gas vesicle protein [bacterium]
MEEARYLYCIADSKEKTSLGKIGIENNEVYTIPYKDLCAVVHNSSTEPYKSEDNEVVKGWVKTHEEVVEAAWKRFAAVLPLGFDTIIKGEEKKTPEESMRDWLKEDYENLRQKMEKVRGKAEYGVQVSWDPRVIAQKLSEVSSKIRKLQEEMESKPKGTAYLYKQKLEKALKEEMTKEADECFKDFYEKIRKCVADLRVEKTKKEKDRQMLMNLSCLVDKDRVKVLGDELEKINNLDGFFVRFTGPWPPYSFV